jgi:cytidylate kinase
MASVYSKLVEKVMGRFRLAEAQSWSADLFPSAGFSHPFITIAREPGSGGHPIGRMVAKRLGFQFVDDELLDEVAKSTKKRKEVLHDIDERGRTAVQDLVQGVINPEYVSDITFVTELTKVISSYAYKGNVVILGRGSNFVTPFAQGLHVRITAPYSVRVQRAIDYEGHTPTRAREVVNKYQKDRKDFVKQYFRKDIEDADHYDLTINTTYFSPDQSVELILQAFHAKFSRMKKLQGLLQRRG